MVNLERENSTFQSPCLGCGSAEGAGEIGGRERRGVGAANRESSNTMREGTPIRIFL